MLEEDSFDVNHLPQSKYQSMEQENRKDSFNTSDERKRNKGGSSKYSFSTDYNSGESKVMMKSLRGAAPSHTFYKNG